ncbi:MAG: hypothetical protein QXM43_03490 [Desulfurococcaceae archaeon]
MSAIRYADAVCLSRPRFFIAILFMGELAVPRGSTITSLNRSAYADFNPWRGAFKTIISIIELLNVDTL